MILKDLQNDLIEYPENRKNLNDFIRDFNSQKYYIINFIE